jgi:hypothetical protein
MIFRPWREIKRLEAENVSVEGIALANEKLATKLQQELNHMKMTAAYYKAKSDAAYRVANNMVAMQNPLGAPLLDTLDNARA